MLLIIFFIIGLSFLIFGFFLSFRNKSIDKILKSNKKNRRTFLFCIVLFLLLFNVSLILFYTRTDPYIRPYSYFIVLSLAVVPLGGQIFFAPEKELYNFLILNQIIILSFSYVLTLNSLYPTLLGADPWGHRVLVEEIISLGYIGEGGWYGGTYKLLPSFHINLSSFSIILDWGYKSSSLISVGLASFIMIIFGIYLAIKEIFYTKLALMTALIVGISNTVVYWVGIAIPNTMGIGFVILVLALLVKKKKNLAIFGIIFLFAFIINLTHSLSYLYLIFQTSIIALVALMYKRKSFNIYLRLSLAILILGIGYWFSVAIRYGHAFVNQVRFLIMGRESEYLAGEGTGATISTSTIILGRLGLILIFTISILGLIWIFVSEREFRKYKILGIGGFAYSIAVFALFGGGLVGISGRFWLYMQIVCGIAVILGILLFLSIIKNTFWKKICVIVIVFLLAVVMFTSPYVNNDNPHTTFHGSTRTGLKESEVAGAEFAVNNISREKIIRTDNYYAGRIRYYNIYLRNDFGNRSSFLTAQNPEEFHYEGNLTMIRDEAFARGVSWRDGFMQIDEDREEYLNRFDYSRNKLYDNGEVFIHN